jgi:hypothetical protein
MLDEFSSQRLTQLVRTHYGKALQRYNPQHVQCHTCQNADNNERVVVHCSLHSSLGLCFDSLLSVAVLLGFLAVVWVPGPVPEVVSDPWTGSRLWCLPTSWGRAHRPRHVQMGLPIVLVLAAGNEVVRYREQPRFHDSSIGFGRTACHQ